MSGETKVQESGWSVDTLKQHFDDLRADDQRAVAAALASAEKAVAAALTASDKATQKAEAAQYEVNKTQNEFRATLKDQAATLMPIKEAEANFDALQKQINDLRDVQKTGAGQATGSQVTIGKIYAAIGAVGAILGILIVIANTLF